MVLDPNVDPKPSTGKPIEPVAPAPAPTEPVASHYQDLAAKKGWKDTDAAAKSYTEIESTYGKTQNAFNQAKQNLESQSQGMYTLDEKGSLVQTDIGKNAQANQQLQPGQPGAYDTAPMYDPYTNQPITDPTQLQLAKMPLGYREAMIFNAMAEQRENLSRSAFQNENEILARDDVKGFEKDIRTVMMQLPLQERGKKETWEKTILQVKGARYDQDKKSFQEQGVDNFLNKSQVQPLPASAGSPKSGASLPPDLEKQFRMYESQRPGLFKDRADFIAHTQPTGGR